MIGCLPYLSARILDYIDKGTINLVDPKAIRQLIASLPAKPFKVVTTHDCFRCLPNYGNDVRLQYNRQLAMIAKSDLLSFMLTQMTRHPVRVGKLNANLHKDVMHANYALS